MRRKLLALVIVVLGIGAGVAATAAYPPFYTSQATVCVSASAICGASAGGEWDPPSLAVMMTSDPVLVVAARGLGRHETASDLRGDLRVTYEGPILTLTAQGLRPRQAKAVASAVIASFADFLRAHDLVLKKGVATRQPVNLTVFRAAGRGIAQRPLGCYLQTAGLGLLAGVLLVFLIVQPSRREVRRGYRAAFRVVFGRGRVATGILDLIDGPLSEDEPKAQGRAGRDQRLAAAG